MGVRDKLTLRRLPDPATAIDRQPFRDAPLHTPTPEDVCVSFVRRLLGSGEAMRKNAIAYEAENEHLSGDRVNLAFFSMNGREYVDRGELMWKLPLE